MLQQLGCGVTGVVRCGAVWSSFVAAWDLPHPLSVLSALLPHWRVMEIALWLIAAGSAVTCVVRTLRIAALLKARTR